jgi:hypothetical protein
MQKEVGHSVAALKVENTQTITIHCHTLQMAAVGSFDRFEERAPLDPELTKL